MTRIIWTTKRLDVRHAATLVLLALACAALPGPARADCKLHPGSDRGMLVFDPPAHVNVPFDAPIGSILWASPMEAPTPVPDLQCNQGSPNQTGVNGSAQLIGGIPTYATTNPAIGFQIAYPTPEAWLPAYPGGMTLPSAHTRIDGQAMLRLVKLGPLANGSMLSGTTLGYWDVRGVGHVLTLTLSHALVFNAPACIVTSDPTDVTLPVVPTGAFHGEGSTAGTTAFAIQLNCDAGITLAVALDTNRPATGHPGVIAGQTGAGYADGIGVQILDAQSQTVAWKDATRVGITQGGAQTLRYFARYFQTGPLAPGQVRATATFTLSYP